MTRPAVYRYRFEETVPLDEVEASLVVALFGAESLFGEARARLEVSHLFDAERRACLIDGSTAPGRAVAKLFAGLLSRGLGPDAFRVERLPARRRPAPAA